MLLGIGADLVLGIAVHAAAGMAAAAPLPEIIVTARRTEEPLEEVPVSVTVFDAAVIERLEATSIDELSRFAPGFSFESATGRGPNSNRPMIRGLTTIRNGIANSTVAATFVDGVYLGGANQSLPLYDLERVEIIRGPQSAQFGRATYAGALNYVTRPASDAFESHASVSAAEHDTVRASGWLSGPLAGKRLRAFLGAGYREYGGEYRNTRDGSTVGGEQQQDVALKIEAEPAAGLAVTLRLALQQTDDDHFAIWLQPRTANNCCLRSPEAPRAREYYIGRARVSDEVTLFTDVLEAAGGAGTEIERQLGSLAVSWESEPGGYVLSSLTGVVSDEIDRGFDVSYAAYDPVPALPGLFLQREEIAQSDFSQELRITSPRDDAVRWSGGAYYYRGRFDDISRNNVMVFEDGTFELAPNPAGLNLHDIENRAAFGTVEATLPGGVTAGLELRYAADEIEVTSPECNPAAPCRDTFRSLTPRLTASWQATDVLMPYINVARGQAPGTFNPEVPDERYRVVDEEVVWSYEVGLRGVLPSGRTRFALALYHLDVEDQQFTTIVERNDGTLLSLLDNVGRSRVNGAEFELAAALGEYVTAHFTYAWTDAEIREQFSQEWADLMGGNGTPEDLRRLGSVAGHKLPRVPEHAASLMLEYRRPLGHDKTWFAGGDWALESSRFAQEDNLIETGDRQLVGLHAGFEWGRASVKLWVDNLTDDDTPVDVQRHIDRRFGALVSCQSYVNRGLAPAGTDCTGSSSTPRGFAISLPRGRQAGATLTYRF